MAYLTFYGAQGHEPIVTAPGWNPAYVFESTKYDVTCADTIKQGCYFLASYNMLNENYDNVYVTYIAHHIDSCYGYYMNDAYYNNESEGIIKISEHNSYTSRVWELQRAHIIR